MNLKKSLPVIATGVISMTVVGQASAAGNVCANKIAHADKLTLQAERYQKRAAQLRPGEHDNQIHAMKRRANNMRAKAIKLKASCTAKPKKSHASSKSHVSYHVEHHHVHFHY